MGSRDFEQPRKEVQERPRSEEYNYQMREMVAAERDHEIRQPLLSVDYGFRSREMAAAECGYDEMQKQPLYDEYSYRMREIQTGGRGHDEIQGRLPSDDYNYPRREIPDVGRGPDNFRQISPEHFNRRSYEQDQRWRRGETSRPAEMFENFPRDDLNRGKLIFSLMITVFRKLYVLMVYDSVLVWLLSLLFAWTNPDVVIRPFQLSSESLKIIESITTTYL